MTHFKLLKLLAQIFKTSRHALPLLLFQWHQSSEKKIIKEDIKAFFFKFSERLFMQMADLIIAEGYYDVGYRLIFVKIFYILVFFLVRHSITY